MQIGLSMSIGARRRQLAASIKSLFAAGEQGVWYDPSDFNRYMEPLGPELVVNGGFDTGVIGWTASATSVLNWFAGRAAISPNVGAVGIATLIVSQGISTTISKRYAVSVKFDKGNVPGDTARITVSNNADGSAAFFATTLGVFGSGTLSASFVATAETTYIAPRMEGVSYGQTWYCDNISVRELTAIDTATLFQDAAGTTPVTAVEQPVGLMLDKSKGLVLGPELWVVGQTTTAITDVGGTVGSYNASTGELRNSLAGTSTYPRFRFSVGMNISKAYKVRVVLSGDTTKIISVLSNDNVAGSQVSPGVWEVIYNPGLHNPAAYNVSLFGSGGVFSGVFIASVSVRELPGNHATQSTAASRPVLSARVNLLTKTDDFADASWPKAATTVTANSTTSPDGTTSAYKLIETETTANHLLNRAGVTSAGGTFTFSYFAKKAERSWTRIQTQFPVTGWVNVDLDSGATGLSGGGLSNYSVEDAGDGWWRISATTVVPAVTFAGAQIFVLDSDRGTSNPAYAGDGTSGIYIWGADLRVANDGVNLPPYQRVNTATDYDTAGFPLYLRTEFDDGMVTNSIDFTGTDKMTVVAGVRKLSDAAGFGIVAELSNLVTAPAPVGTFSLSAPAVAGTNTYFFVSRGTVNPITNNGATATGFYSPHTSVLTAAAEISSDTMLLRVNRTQAASGTADQGTGNYGNYPLYLFRRGGTTLPFNGRCYGLIVRGAQSTDAQIAQAEKWMAKKTGVTL